MLRILSLGSFLFFCLFLLLLAANEDVQELNLEQFQRFSAVEELCVHILHEKVSAVVYT